MVVEGEALIFGLQMDTELKRSHGWTGSFIAELGLVSSGMSIQWCRIDYGMLLRKDDARCGMPERSRCRCP